MLNIIKYKQKFYIKNIDKKFLKKLLTNQVIDYVIFKNYFNELNVHAFIKTKEKENKTEIIFFGIIIYAIYEEK